MFVSGCLRHQLISKHSSGVKVTPIVSFLRRDYTTRAVFFWRNVTNAAIYFISFQMIQHMMMARCGGRNIIKVNINSLWPSDAILGQGPGSTLAQVMAQVMASIH